ncbi:hypothetical protein F5Y15DRAFT_388311 [Xylariaceae sp. FL0016]|nr:hypothetical protein F5Y15DRAFT_388311 [Xylariaceae sp. FL0016]
MKRQRPEDLSEASLPKRTRTGTELTLPDLVLKETETANNELDAPQSLSDEESRYTDTAPSVTATDTPLTAQSPAPRKYPSEEKTILCPHPGCLKTFNRPARLRDHMRSHTKERPYKCPHDGCDKDYMERKHLRQHIKGSHTKEFDYVCSEPGCGQKFMTSTRLNRHQLVHEGQERFKCRDFPPCSESFRKHQTLQRHIRTQHLGEPAYPCEHRDSETGVACGEGFESANTLKRHMEKEHGNLRYWCDECARHTDANGASKKVGFPSAAQLQVHMKQAHIQCMFCNQIPRDDLDQHLESAHGVAKKRDDPEKPLEERKNVLCSWEGCSKAFTRVSNLNAHIKSSHLKVKWICGQFDLSKAEDLANWPQSDGCGESFVTKANLENHVRYVHMKMERPMNNPTPHVQHTSFNGLEELAGVGENSRRTLRCSIFGCNAKFTHFGELEEHEQNEHAIDISLFNQSLINGALPDGDLPLFQESGLATDAQFDLPDGTISDGIYPAGALSASAQPNVTLPIGDAGFESDFAGNEFWIGAPHPTTAAHREWERDQADMRKIIGDGDLDVTRDLYQDKNLEALIDPALSGEL